MKATRSDYLPIVLAVSAILVASPDTFAASAGFNQTAAGPWDYNTSGNWAGGTINGLWDTSLTLSAAQTITYAADTALSTGLTFNYAGDFALTLQASAAGTRNLTLGGDVSLNTGGGTSANVTIGNSANHLNLNLGGTTRTVTVAGSRTLTFLDVVSNGGITKAGAGTLTLSANNSYNGGLTITDGTVSSTATQGFGAAGSTVSIGAAGTASVTLGSDQNVNNVFTGTGILTVSGSTGTPNFNNASALNGFTGTFNVNTSGSKKVALTTAGGNIGSGATVNIASGATLYVNLSSTFSGVTFTLAGAGNSENLGALRLEGGATIGASSPIVLSGNTQLGGNNTASTINAIISETGGSRSVEKVGSGTMTFAGNNSYNGATILTAGTLSVSTDSAGAYNLGGTTGNNGITFNGGTLQITGTTMTSFGSHTPTFTATKTVNLDIANAANNFTVSQNVNQTSGALVKVGAGTLTLSGSANSYTGGTRANAGTLTISGALTGNGFVSVNNVGAQNATLKVVSGASVGMNDFNMGEAANSRAAIFQSGGDVTVNNTSGTAFALGRGAGSYGYYSLSGGSITMAGAVGGGEIGIGAVGNNATVGVFDMSGGTISAQSWILPGRGNTTSSGLLNVTGGTITQNGRQLGMLWGNSSGALAIVNVGGGTGAAAFTGWATTTTTDVGIDLARVNTVGAKGIVNLITNGTMTVSMVKVTSANPDTFFNFNGGTLKATTANAGGSFMTPANLDGVYIYPGGGTIDNNGTAITISRPLLAPTDNGVSSIAITTKGSGYIGAPLVAITGGTGNGATAYAVMADDGTGNGTFKVDSFVITSPGVYTVAPTTVTLTGGGADTAASGFTINMAANTSGGMTFQGSGATTLSAANTYSGTTTISAGTLALSGSGSLAGNVSVASGATFSPGAAYSFGKTLSGQGTVSSAAVTITNGGAVTPRNGVSASTLTFSGSLTLSSASANFTLATTASGSNDKVNFGGSGSTLTLNNTDTINITCTTLETANPYTLFASSGGSVSMATTPTLNINGVPSDQTTPGSYKLAIVGSSLVLQYIPLSPPPTVNSASASPCSLVHNQTTTITVNVMPAAGQSITSVSVTADGLGGAGDPVTLSGPGGDGAGNWTGTFSVPANKPLGSYSIGGTVLQSDSSLESWAVNGISVVASSPVWDGGGGDANWSTGNNWSGTPENLAPGTVGDSVTFSGNTQTSPNMEQAYSVSGLALGSGASADFTIGGSSTLTVGATGIANNSTTANQLTLNPPVALSAAASINAASGNITLGSTVANGGNLLTVTGASNTTASGAISGSGGLTKTGTGTLTLAANNSYSGATAISGGKLNLAASGVLPDGTTVTLGTSGTLELNNVSETITRLNLNDATLTQTNGALTLTQAGDFGLRVGDTAGTTATYTLSGGSLTLINAGNANFGGAGNGTFNQTGGSVNTASWTVIARNAGSTGLYDISSGTLTHNHTTSRIYVGENGSGTLNISGSGLVQTTGGVRLGNTGGTGIVNLNGGTLQTPLIEAGNTSASQAFYFNGGTLKAGGNSAAFIANMDTLQIRNGGAIIDDNGNTITIGQGIAHSSVGGDNATDGGLTKLGTGTLTLSGASTYTGNTTVSNGTLLVNSPGSLGNTAVAVKTGATLGGSGTLGGAVTVETGGTLAPGTASLGTLTINNSLSLAGNASFRLNKSGTTLTSDQVAGATSVAAGGVLNVTASGSALADGDTFTLFSVTPSGMFSTVNLPAIPASGTNWWTTDNYQTISYNVWPTAGNPAYSRAKGTTWKIRVADLLTNVTGAIGGKTITLAALGSPGVSGATLTTDGASPATSTRIFYTPGPSDASDSFTYTVSDGRGGSATGTVAINVAGAVGPSLGTNSLSIVDGTATITVYGIPNYTYALETATNLGGTWWPVATNTAATNGVLIFLDPNATNTQQYYRTAQP